MKHGLLKSYVLMIMCSMVLWSGAVEQHEREFMMPVCEGCSQLTGTVTDSLIQRIQKRYYIIRRICDAYHALRCIWMKDSYKYMIVNSMQYDVGRFDHPLVQKMYYDMIHDKSIASFDYGWQLFAGYSLINDDLFIVDFLSLFLLFYKTVFISCLSCYYITDNHDTFGVVLSQTLNDHHSYETSSCLIAETIAFLDDLDVICSDGEVECALPLHVLHPDEIDQFWIETRVDYEKTGMDELFRTLVYGRAIAFRERKDVAYFNVGKHIDVLRSLVCRLRKNVSVSFEDDDYCAEASELPALNIVRYYHIKRLTAPMFYVAKLSELISKKDIRFSCLRYLKLEDIGIVDAVRGILRHHDIGGLEVLWNKLLIYECVDDMCFIREIVLVLLAVHIDIFMSLTKEKHPFDTLCDLYYSVIRNDDEAIDDLIDFYNDIENLSLDNLLDLLDGINQETALIVSEQEGTVLGNSDTYSFIKTMLPNNYWLTALLAYVGFQALPEDVTASKTFWLAGIFGGAYLLKFLT
ncbi:MAG: hypothetical protein WBQ73_02660 [Candidatus Babeliales bacterium]